MARFRVTEIGTFWNVWQVEAKDRDEAYEGIQDLDLDTRVRHGMETDQWEVDELEEGEDA